MQTSFTAADWAVLIGYVALLAAAGWLTTRWGMKAEDHFLAGHHAPTWPDWGDRLPDMRSIPIVIAAHLLASCAAPSPEDVRFPGTIDADYYERYTHQTLTAGALLRCESGSLSTSDVLALRDEYEAVDSYIAYQTLTVTPCVFNGHISYKGKPATFRWYPSGYLAISRTENNETRTEYFICPGKSDQDGISSCNREHELSRLQ